MKTILEITSGLFAGHKQLLRSQACLRIGRTEMADWAIPHDAELSSVHFRIACGLDEVRIQDLESTNGTFVNSKRITDATLADGDMIVAGRTAFRITVEEPSPRDLSPGPMPAATQQDTATHSVKETTTAPVSNIRVEKPQNRDELIDADRGAVSSMAAADIALPGTPASAGAHSGAGANNAILEVQDGPHAGRKIWLRLGQSLTIGRTDLANVALSDDPLVSSTHCRLTFDKRGLSVRDLNSANGTFVNEMRIVEQSLADADFLRLGNTVIRVSAVGSASSTAAHAKPPESGPEHFVTKVKPARTAIDHDPIGCVPANTKLPFRAALRDEDPLVRREALQAAAWTRQSWLLSYCRLASERPSEKSFDVHLLLAILGAPDDLELILRIGKDVGIGPGRLKILGAYGHPEIVTEILAAVHSDEAAIAFAAGQAFTKITGADIESEDRATLPPADGSEPDEFEAEFLDDVILPDPALAERHWSAVKESFAHGSRYCRGFDVSGEVSSDLLQSLDLESRWEACLRGKYRGNWQGNPSDLLRLAKPG